MSRSYRRKQSGSAGNGRPCSGSRTWQSPTACRRLHLPLRLLLMWNHAPPAHHCRAMDWDAEELRNSVRAGDVCEVRRWLTDAPQLATATDGHGHTAAHFAAVGCGEAGLQVLKLLLDTNPALAAAPTAAGDTPLHYAGTCGSPEAVRLLLGAAPSAAQLAGTANMYGALPLHLAARRGCVAAVQLLLQAAPGTAAALTHEHQLPLDWAFWLSSRLVGGPLVHIASLLIAAPGQQPHDLLQCLNRHTPEALPLFAQVAAHYPLSPPQWQLIPSPCPGLAAALPAVLERSEAEAALLVARLPAAECRGLRTAALALHRTQAHGRLWLPLPLMWRILAACLS